jgi:hypothetical protein
MVRELRVLCGSSHLGGGLLLHHKVLWHLKISLWVLRKLLLENLSFRRWRDTSQLFLRPIISIQHLNLLLSTLMQHTSGSIRCEDLRLCPLPTIVDLRSLPWHYLLKILLICIVNNVFQRVLGIQHPVVVSSHGWNVRLRSAWRFLWNLLHSKGSYLSKCTWNVFVLTNGELNASCLEL